jgi:hypothetical protein
MAPGKSRAGHGKVMVLQVHLCRKDLLARWPFVLRVFAMIRWQKGPGAAGQRRKRFHLHRRGLSEVTLRRWIHTAFCDEAA